MSLGTPPISNRLTTFLVFGSIREMVVSSVFSTQTASSPTATLLGAVRLSVNDATRPVPGSIAATPLLSTLTWSPPSPAVSATIPAVAAAHASNSPPSPISNAARRGARGRDSRRVDAPSCGSCLRIACSSSCSDRPGSSPKLLPESLPRFAVHRQRLDLTAGAVQREHQLRAQPLTQRELAYQRVQLADQLLLVAEREIGVDPVLQRRQASLLEPCDLSLSERLVGEVGQRRTAPQPERVAKTSGRGGGICAVERSAALGRQPLELVSVELIGRKLELIPGPPGVQQAIAQRPAQVKDVSLQCLGGSRGRSLAPQIVDQPLARDHPTAVQQQDRKHRSLLSPTQDSGASRSVTSSGPRIRNCNTTPERRRDRLYTAHGAASHTPTNRHSTRFQPPPTSAQPPDASVRRTTDRNRRSSNQREST